MQVDRMLQGIVLAGGKSSRFGEDKALAAADGITLIEKAVGLLRGLGLETAIITNETRDYSFLNCPVYRDLIPGKGPLGGFFTASRIFEGSSLIMLTCDMPGLTLDSLKLLQERYNRQNQVTLFSNREGSTQPFPGIYDTCLAELCLKCITENRLSMREFLREISKAEVIRHDLDPGIFSNINRKSDLESWLWK